MGALLSRLGPFLAGGIASRVRGPDGIVKLGRFLYSITALGIVVAWYTGWRNERVPPGNPADIPIPGISKDRPKQFRASREPVPDSPLDTGPGLGGIQGIGGKPSPGLGGITGGAGASTHGGARGVVEQAAQIAAQYGTFVVSAHRPGDSGSDHSGNDAHRAARDIAVQGIDAHTGPPSPRLDRAVVAIGHMFGRNYGNGNRTIIDTFNWNGFRIQIIWRTPLYGGHMGHIHIGARGL